MKARWWIALGAAILVAGAAHGAYLYSSMHDDTSWVRRVAGGDPARAPELMVANGCAGCHVIPGVPGATGALGPSLGAYADRGFIAGVLPNNAGNLVAWIRRSRDIDPNTAMPNINVADEDARAIAAFLYQPCVGLQMISRSCLERRWPALRRIDRGEGT
jgi:cytochrome c1